MSLFRSFSNVPIVKPQSKPEMAAELAAETCERLKELKAEALEREANAEPPMDATQEQKDCYTTLEALMKGPHRWCVAPVLLEHFPELVRAPDFKST